MGLFGSSFPWHEFLPPAIPKIVERVPFGRRVRHPFHQFQTGKTVENVLDVGANIGVVAEAALRSFPTATVFCFEPVAATYQKLLQRLAPYGSRAKARQLALSDVNDETLINLTTFHGTNSLHRQTAFHRHFHPHVCETSQEKISLARLDDLVQELPPKIDIMKIDVEGHELNVLRGGSTVLRERVDSVIIEAALMRDSSWEHQSIFEIFSHLKSLDFCLVNVFDVHHSRRGPLRLLQMDCVFQKRAFVEALELV